MDNLFEEMAGLDRLIHEPARLAILTALASCKSADFLFLQRLTGLSGGNLSSHVAKLEEAGLVQIEKQFIDKRPNTRIEISDQGRKAVREHWKKLDQLGEKAREWKRD
ncbi:MAG: ArsR family transcriptional regulator [Chloroflexi bacterium RBG_13_60_9]|nr:MAG: ArsR family transcriptional regulator [Chloroflexi bacterium RBG_13_60_9]